MGLAVIGAGFGRTGTFSIKAALEQLGFGPCYHMDNVFSTPGHLDRWQAVANGGQADWDELFEGYASTVDWPGMLYYRQLANRYPDARVLLSVRPADVWWDSFSRTIRRLIGMRDQVPDDHLRRVLHYAQQIIAEQTFGGSLDDEHAVIDSYNRHIDEVIRNIESERLLVYDVTQGWGPMCGFLGVAEPDNAFPHCNTEEDFWRHFGAGAT